MVTIRLANKYRPGQFEDVVGQDIPARILRSIVMGGGYRSAYMFEGPTGVGKTTLARIFAKAVLCSNHQQGNPCNSCESCRLFDSGRHYGYREMDAASTGGKDDMIGLRDEASFQTVGSKKILYLDESQDISPSGQDSLLKQVEDCPEHLIYLFSTTDPDKMKETLRNRCMEFQVTRVDSNLVFDRLKKVCDSEQIEYEEDALHYIANDSEGHVRNAINMVEDSAYLGCITLENVRKMLKNFDDEVCQFITGLGMDLNRSLKSIAKISSMISVVEIYRQVVSMLSDSAKLLYGYGELSRQRRVYAERIRDTHGFKVLEFLDYLVKRDKFVDRVGLHSDIVLLHYKFLSGSFMPQEEQPPTTSKSIPAPSSDSEKPAIKSTSSTEISHSSLSKLSVEERSKVLRNHNKIRKDSTGTGESERVPGNWPLPKDQRSGESNTDQTELSPEEFSRMMVGGRGGGI